jgi:hypothetical protein
MKTIDIKKRYWLFIYSTYYPMGGMHDARGSADSLDEIQAIVNGVEPGSCDKQYHVFDSIENKIVSHGEITL